MAFGQIVRFHRNAKGSGLNEFAERLGVSPAYCSRVEREQENPTRDDLVERVAAILEGSSMVSSAKPGACRPICATTSSPW